MPLDDEGVPSQRTVLVQEGILKGYLYDRLTSLQGWGQIDRKRQEESYQHKPIPRMSNTMIVPGRRSLKGLCVQ